MAESNTELSRFERFLTLFTRVRAGEGRSIFLFSLYAFVLLATYYVFKDTREGIILAEFNAEVKAYAIATVALVLFFIVPLYGVLYRRTDPVRLIQWITAFFAMNVVVFYLLGTSGASIGFFYFVWVSIFGVMIIAQFWSLTADSYNVKTGQRLFPVIMIGALMGSLVGPRVVIAFVEQTGPYLLMLFAGVVLVATVGLTKVCRDSVPKESHAIEVHEQKNDGFENALGGFAIVARDRYLLLLALFVVLLNWINSTGEYILGATVAQQAGQMLAAGEIESEAVHIAKFYGHFHFWVNLAGFSIQGFLVARIYRVIGVTGALLIAPIVVAFGYALIAFVPIFSIIRLVKIAENSLDYSLQNTNRQTLWLPVSKEAKYQAKTAVDTFFYRFGDLIQAGFIFAGLNWWNFGVRQFALMNLLLAFVWIGLAYMIGREYNRLRSKNLTNAPPQLNRPVGDLWLGPGAAVDLRLPHDTFVDADPGDALEIQARVKGGAGLPEWLSFDSHRLHFSGRLPMLYQEHIEIEIVASDLDGLSVTETFFIRVRG